MSDSPFSLPINLRPGDRITVRSGGFESSQVVTSVTHSSGGQSRRVDLSRWRRFVRALTPKRWRKPELWSPPGGGLSTLVYTTYSDDPFWCATGAVADAAEMTLKWNPLPVLCVCTGPDGLYRCPKCEAK